MTVAQIDNIVELEACGVLGDSSFVQVQIDTSHEWGKATSGAFLDPSLNELKLNIDVTLKITHPKVDLSQ